VRGAFLFFLFLVSCQQAAVSDLQVPLSRTAAEREAFGKELIAWRSLELRPLYEKHIAAIGANGLIEEVQRIRPTCHDEGHDLGRVIYARTLDLAAALHTCQDACFSGCMHGVLMEAMGAEESELGLANVREAIPTMCASDTLTELYLPGDCAHGMGHAAMYLSGYGITTAIEACDTFSEYPMRYYCATGAYMEYVNTRSRNGVSLAPCDTAPYPAACFRYRMVHVIREHYRANGTLAGLQDACASLDGKYRAGCFHGLGNAHSPGIAQRKWSLSGVCGGEPDDQYACIEGAMERMAKYAPKSAERVCATVSGWQRELCDQSVEHRMYSLEKAFDLYPE